MVRPEYTICPGCGVRLPATDAPADARFHASAECWQVYGELTGYTVALGYRTGEFIHQLSVDTYGAQHFAADARTIGPAFALIGLYLTYERGYTGSQVQHMHMLLAQRSKSWPRFVRPAHTGEITVVDVMQAPPGEERDAMLRRWGRSVWDAWSHEHAHVQDLFERVMAD